MYFFLILLAAVQAAIQLKSSEFYIINAGNPESFAHNVYIFSYEECRFKAGFLDGSILKTLLNADAPYGCYLSTKATPPTIYWNSEDTSQDCSTDFGCVVTEAKPRDTFFYGKSELKNISDKRQTKTHFLKQLFDKTPTILTTNRESVRQDDCKVNCDPKFNSGNCQDSWTFEPEQSTRPLAGPTWVSVEDNFGLGSSFLGSCDSVTDCKDKCSNNVNCMGYTKYNFRDDTLDWPSASEVYDGTPCDNDVHCKDQCKNNADCEGYTQHWWPVYGDNEDKMGTEIIPVEECTPSLVNMIYPSNHEFEHSATPGYSTMTNYRSSSTSTYGITGCQIRDEKCNSHSVRGNYYWYYEMPDGRCHYHCRYYTGHGGWNVFYTGGDGNVETRTSSFTREVVHRYWYNDPNRPSTFGTCNFYAKNIGIRKRVRWSYGPKLQGTAQYLTNSKKKTFNTVQYLYGLKDNTLSELYSPTELTERKALRHQDEEYKNNVFSLTKTECISAATVAQNIEWKDYQLGTPLTLTTVKMETLDATISVNVQELGGSITDLNTDKLPYGCIAAYNGKLFWNSNNLASNFKQCGVFRIESYTGYLSESTLDTTSNLNDFILPDNEYYSVTCLQHPLVDCTWENSGGGKLFEKDLLNFPTTNEDIAYVQSDRRISLLHPIKTNAEDALRYCLDLCDRTDQCFYANIGDDNACEMYRKCESTSASKKALYRKLPFFLNLSSTLSDQANDYYYDIGVLDNTCAISEPRPECYLDYCNRHADIRAMLCDDTCDSDEELEACKNHWNTTGSLDASRNFDPETECTRSLFIAQTSRDEDCPTFCITTEGCNVAYKTEDACYALPQCIMSSGEAQGHVITKIIRDQHYHELFPYNAFWACDAMVLENTDIDACVTEARREDRFVFSYNNDTRKCLIYEHYVENAYDELMDHGINASWCYSNNVLQNAITSFGTCSATVQNEDNKVLQVVDGAFETLVANPNHYDEVTSGLPDMSVSSTECSSMTKYAWGGFLSNINEIKGCYLIPSTATVYYNTHTGSVAECNLGARACIQRKAQDTCIDKFTTLTSTATIDLSSNLLTYLNVVDALTACFETSDCNYIVKYTAQQQIVLAKDVTVTVHEVSSGAPDLSVTKAACEQYATSIGRPFYHDTTHAHYAWGCTRYFYDNAHVIYWSEHPDASNKVCGQLSHRCIQQTGTSVGTYAKVNKLCDLPPNACIDLETRAITSKTSGYADTSIVENFDNYTRTSVDCQSAAEELGYDYKGKYREVTSGAPDLSLSQSDCEAYGLSIGKWAYTYDWTDPSGCVKLNDGRIYYNTRSTSNSCSSIAKCIQKLPMDVANGCVLYESNVYWNKGPFDVIVVANKFDACSDSDHCFVGKPEVASEFTPITEIVTSGAPDLSLSEEECKTYGTSMGNWYGAATSNTYITGCFMYNNNVYYNRNQDPTSVSGGNVCQASYQCIQKKQLLLEDCMVAVHKLGKEAGHHALGANIDGTGAYTGGSCWYKNSGVLGTSIAAPNVLHKTSGFPTDTFNADKCGSAAVKLGLSYYGTTSDFFKAQGCVEVDGELVYNDRSAATNTIASEFISVQAVQLLDTCQAACQTDDDCIGQLICSDTTIGCTGTESDMKYCVYDGHCSEQYPCIDEREQCGTQRRRLLQVPGNSVGNPDSSDAEYNEDISCTRVEYWNDRQVSSFNVKTKENNIGGYVVGGTETSVPITDIDYCRQLDNFDAVIDDPRKPYGCFMENSNIYFNTVNLTNVEFYDHHYEYVSYGGTSSTTVSLTNPSLIDNAPALVNYGASYENIPSGQDKLFACQGDCDFDYQCSGNLLCFQRIASQPVPGCSIGGTGDVNTYDYCYDPDALITVTRDAKVGATWDQVRLPYTATELSSSYHNVLSFEVNRCNSNVDCIGVAVASAYAEAVYRTDTFEACNDGENCAPAIAFFKRKARPLFQAPCTATTPCLKHREKPFNATYALDPVTGISTCYEGSGAQVMQPHFIQKHHGFSDMSITYDECKTYAEAHGHAWLGLSTDMTLGSQWQCNDGHRTCYGYYRQYAWGNCIGQCTQRDTPKGCNYMPTANWMWYTSEETSVACGVEAGESGAGHSYKTVCMQKNNMKSRLLATNVQEALPEIAGMVRSDNCPAPYQWSDKSDTFIQVSSGAPDMSVNAAQCQAYAETTSGLYWHRVDSWSHFHKGCSVFITSGTSDDNVYFNTQDTAHDCGVEGHNCIQKLDLKEDNYKTYVLGSVQYDVGADTCDTCFPGHYTSESGVCLPCQAGRYTSRQRIAAQGYMPSCTICEVGRFQNEEGQASCKACARGNYQNERGQLSCKTVDSGKFGVGTGAWTGTSGPDQSNSISDTATFLEGATDQASECDPDEGYFYNCINSDGSKSLPDLTGDKTIQEACEGGNFECARCGRGTKIENNGCVDCPQGQFQNANFAIGDSCKLCLAGFYQSETGSINCKSTDKGYYQSQKAQSYQIKCLTGRFQDQRQKASCKLCLVGRSAREGQTLTLPGTARDTLEECFQCSEGLYQDEEGQTICKYCQAGKFTDSTKIGTAENQHQFERCIDCDSGFFRPLATSPKCQGASPGYFVEITGATTEQPCPIGSKSSGEETDPNCDRCEAGKFQDETGQAFCKNCAQGYFTNSLSYHTTCTACNPGETTSGSGQTECKSCEAGTYSSSTTGFLCQACASGFYSGSGASSCTPCSKGYKGNTGTGYTSSSDACVACGEGMYQDEEGKLTCKVCNKGRYSDVTTLTDGDKCKECPAGTFLADDATTADLHDAVADCLDCQNSVSGSFSTAGSSECSPCPEGNQATKSGGSDFVNLCLPCAAGKYNSDENSNCKLCSSLQKQPEEGKTFCIPCGVGKVASANRLECSECGNGKYRSANMNACENCPVGKYNGGDHFTACASVAYPNLVAGTGGGQCANSGATSPTDTYENNCGTVSGNAMCQCVPTGACVRCLDYSHRQGLETQSKVFQTITNTLSCFDSYTDVLQFASCIAGTIGGIVQSTQKLIQEAKCEHYVLSGC